MSDITGVGKLKAASDKKDADLVIAKAQTTAHLWYLLENGLDLSAKRVPVTNTSITFWTISTS